MAKDISKGSKVKYTVGRGKSTGVVVGFAVALVKDDSTKRVWERKISKLKPIAAVLALVCAMGLSLSAHAQILPTPQALCGITDGIAPTNLQIDCLVKTAQAQANTAAVKAVRDAVVPAPATTTTTVTTTPSFISAAGILGMSWWDLAGYAISALLLIFGIFKGGQYLAIAKRVKTVIGDAAEACYLIAEKDFADLSGEKKFAAAMGNLVKIFADNGLTVTDSVQAQVSTIWAKLAATPNPVVVTQVAVPVIPAVDPAVLSQAQANANAAAAIADVAKTATDIANAAAKK